MLAAGSVGDRYKSGYVRYGSDDCNNALNGETCRGEVGIEEVCAFCVCGWSGMPYDGGLVERGKSENFCDV